MTEQWPPRDFLPRRLVCEEGFSLTVQSAVRVLPHEIKDSLLQYLEEETSPYLSVTPKV